MLYTVVVDEVVSKQRLYTIEADSTEEAECKAGEGDNIDELDIDDGDVIDRFVTLGTTRVTSEKSL